MMPCGIHLAVKSTGYLASDLAMTLSLGAFRSSFEAVASGRANTEDSYDSIPCRFRRS